MNKNSTKILSLKPEDREEEEEEDEEKMKRKKGKTNQRFSCSINKSSKIKSIVLIVHVVVGIVVDLLTYKVPDVEN